MKNKNTHYIYLIDATVRFYRKHVLLFAKVFFGFILAMAPLDIFFWNNERLRNHLILDYSLDTFKQLDFVANVIALLLLSLFILAVFKSIKETDQGTSKGALEIYRDSLNVYGPFLWVVTLFVFKTLAWSLLLIFPGIFFGAYYSLAPLAFIVDGVKGKEALVLSKSLVKPNFNRYLDNLLFCVAIVLGLCLPVAVGLDYFFYNFLKVNNFLAARLIEFLAVVFAGFAADFIFIFSYHLYQGLKEQAATG